MGLGPPSSLPCLGKYPTIWTKKKGGDGDLHQDKEEEEEEGIETYIGARKRGRRFGTRAKIRKKKFGSAN